MNSIIIIIIFHFLGYLSNRFIGRVLGYDTYKKFNHLISINKQKLPSSSKEKQANKFSTNKYLFDNVNWSSHILDKQVVKRLTFFYIIFQSLSSHHICGNFFFSIHDIKGNVSFE